MIESIFENLFKPASDDELTARHGVPTFRKGEKVGITYPLVALMDSSSDPYSEDWSKLTDNYVTHMPGEMAIVIKEKGYSTFYEEHTYRIMFEDGSVMNHARDCELKKL